jgi:hypothetical protein
MKRFLFLVFCLIAFNSQAEELLIDNSSDNLLTVIEATQETTILRYEINKLHRKTIDIDGKAYDLLRLSGESISSQKGKPSLPLINRALVINNHSSMIAKITDSEFLEFQLGIAPSKGKIEIGTDPATIPYTFDDIYKIDSFYPADIVQLSEPYILRDFRGINFALNPVQYNPTSNTVRIYTSLEIKIFADGNSSINTKSRQPSQIVHDYLPIYKRHFINFAEFIRHSRYPEIDEIPGMILIVCHEPYMEAMEPFIEWKKQKGIHTEIIAMADIGTTNTQLLNYLQAVYDEDIGLTWVLFVGDAQHIPVIYSYSTYAGDPYYSQLEGTDYYADIMVGRFSAQSIADVETQVVRSIHYERDIYEGSWLEKAAGVAYNGGPMGQHYEGGWEHMNYIRDDLLAYGYSQVDQIYEGQGGTTQMLANAINDGRGIINYLGHGEDTNYHSIPFYQADVYNLQNVGKLPLISNCACLIGNFAPLTCFAEFWLRATNSQNEPIGAIGVLASSVSQWIGDPEYGQDEFVDIICAEEKQTMGGLFYNCINYAMEVTTEWDEFSCWNVFGDPSLVVRTKIPQQINLSYMPAIFMGLPLFEVDAGEPNIHVCLSREGEIVATGFTDENGSVSLDLSNAQQIPGELMITATGFNKITSWQTIQMIPPDGEYLYIDCLNLISGDDTSIEAGEIAGFDLNFTNYGTDLAENVYLEMFIDDPWLELLTSYVHIGNILPQQNIDLQQALSFQVSDLIEFAHPFNVQFVFTTNVQEWHYDYWFTSYAPNGLWMNPFEINHELVAGDIASLDLFISNFLDDPVEINLRVQKIDDRSIEGSFIQCDTESFLPGEPAIWNFTADNMSLDNEWIYEIELSFPQAVDIKSASHFTGASGGDMITESNLGYGASIIWNGISPNGWGFLHSGESATCQIEADIDYLNLDSLIVEWRLAGDGYGAEPHQVYGSIQLNNPLSWIYLDNIHEVIPAAAFCHTVIELDAQSLLPGDYHCEIVIADSRLETIIPVNLVVLPLTCQDDDAISPANQLAAFPNPFNPLLHIDCTISEPSDIILNIYNLKGQKIDTVFEGYKGSGTHKFSWQAQNFASGIYLLQLNTARHSNFQKVLLLK